MEHPVRRAKWKKINHNTNVRFPDLKQKVWKVSSEYQIPVSG